MTLPFASCRAMRSAPVVCGLLWALLPLRAPGGEGPLAWELRPYEIQLYVAAADGPGAGGVGSGGVGSAAPAPQRAEALAEFLAARVRAVVGGSWHLQAAAAPPALARAMLADLAAIAAADLPPESTKKDKVMLLVVTEDAGQSAVAAREYDVATASWNSTVRRSVAQPAALRRAAMRTLLAAFAPLGRIERADGGTALVRVRAGSIPRRDPALPLLQSGTLFRPVLVAGPSSRDLTPIDWTWLVPGKIDGALLECQVETGLKAPAIPDFHPLRERLALGVTAVPEEVRLTIHGAGTPPAGVAGLDILATNPGSPEQQFVGRTDRAGLVVIPPSDKPLRILLVNEGAHRLARLPLVAGPQRELSVSVTPDPGRLAAERFLLATRDTLVDASARRELLIARIRNHLDRDEAAKGRKLLAEVKSLPNEEGLTAQIEVEERRLWPKGRPASGPLVAEFSELREQVKKHLGKGPIEELDSELAE